METANNWGKLGSTVDENRTKDDIDDTNGNTRFFWGLGPLLSLPISQAEFRTIGGKKHDIAEFR